MNSANFRNPFKILSDVAQILNGGKRCKIPVAGTPVYCKLAGTVEHTGIYIGDRKIVQLNGDGNVEAVSPEEFCARLDGLNPAWTIYFPQAGGRALGDNGIADRARRKIGSRRNYNVLLDNCHQFTVGCISGNFENSCNFFWMVQVEIFSKFEKIFTWEEWKYQAKQGNGRCNNGICHLT